MATQGTQRRTYGALTEQVDEQLKHAVVRTAVEGRLPIVFTAMATRDALSLEFHVVGGPLRYHPDRVLVRFGDGCIVQLDVGEAIEGVTGIPMTPSIEFDGEGYVVHVAIPWSSLPRRPDADDAFQQCSA